MFSLCIRAVASVLLKAVDAFNSLAEPYRAPDWRGSVTPSPAKIQSSYVRALSDLTSFLHFDTMGSKVWVWNQDANDLGDNCVWQGIFTAWAYMTGSAMKPGAVRGLAALAAKPRFTGPTILLRGMCRSGEVTPPPDRTDFFYVTETGSEVEASSVKSDPLVNEYTYLCKDDASLDSLIGFLYGAAYAHGDVSSEAIDLKAGLSELATSIAAAGYKLSNRDGSPTEYGDISPSLTQFPLRLLTLLLLLRLAGKSEEYESVFAKTKPLLTCAETHFLGNRGWSNDHLAFMVYDALLLVEPDPKFRNVYMSGLSRLNKKAKDCGNPFFSAVCLRWLGEQACVNADEDIKVCLHDFSVPKAAVERKNSTRTDLQTTRLGKELVAIRPLRMYDRVPTDHFWQRGAYQLDGFIGVAVPYVKFFCLDYLYLHAYYTTACGREIN